MCVEELAPLKAGEVLVRVEAAGLNHAETLIRSGNYTVRLPFPHAVGGEGSGTVVATESGVTMSVGTRVCWGAVLGSCATFVTAPASMLVPIPDGLSFEDGACLASGRVLGKRRNSSHGAVLRGGVRPSLSESWLVYSLDGIWELRSPRRQGSWPLY